MVRDLSPRAGAGAERPQGRGGTSHVVAVLVRLAVLAIGLTLYTVLVVPAMSESGDADIGAGLIAFGALVLVGFAGGLVDARRRGAPVAVAWWLAVAAGLALGWWLVPPLLDRSGDTSYGELLAMDAGIVTFSFGLVAVPAVIGAVIGAVLGRSLRTAGPRA